MKNKKEISASILIIGNEILSGRTKDLNTSAISKWLNLLGIKVMEVRIIPDAEKQIINNVRVLSKKYNYVFTSGGIGPTHDDITAKCVSKAFFQKYQIHKKAFKILENYYGKEDFNEGRQRMVWMPSKANLILNPSSGAPGFYVKNPGAPLEGFPDFMLKMFFVYLAYHLF